MDESISVFEPVATAGSAAQQTLHALDGLDGKIVGFVDNAKPNFNYLVDDIAQLLVEKYGVAAVIKQRKKSAGVPAPDAVMQDLIARCDAVITGSGD